jgi:hypothetical protein
MLGSWSLELGKVMGGREIGLENWRGDFDLVHDGFQGEELHLF